MTSLDEPGCVGGARARASLDEPGRLGGARARTGARALTSTRSPEVDLVEIWYIPLSLAEARVDALAATLDDIETARAGRFRWPEHRRRYMVAHGAVRTIVGRRLGLQPRQVPWTAGHNGKPALTDGPDEVSLSHSGDLAVLAISRRGVGVDVEQITPGLETAALARRFSPAEAAGLQAMPAARRAPAFTAMWTRKEALVKAAGSRLGHGLGVEIDHDAVVRLPGDRRRHRVRDLPDIPLLPGDRGDYRAAVALAGVSPYHVRVHHWNAEENL